LASKLETSLYCRCDIYRELFIRDSQVWQTDRQTDTFYDSKCRASQRCAAKNCATSAAYQQ